MTMRRPGVISKYGSRSIYMPGKSGGDPRSGVGPYGAGLPPFAYNVSPANFTKLRAGYLAYKAGTRNLIIGVNGDSTDKGVDETAVPYNSQYTYSVAEFLAAEFRNAGIPSGANNFYGISGNNLADYVARDGRVTVGGTAAMGSTIVQGGAGLSMSSATATMTFTPQGDTDTADIYTMQFSGFNGAQLNVLVDGVQTAVITQNATTTIRKTTVPLGSVGPHTITINWGSGSNALYGIECYDSTRKEVTLRQWAISGGTASMMIDNTGANQAGRLNQMGLFVPDAIFGDLGLVNSWRASVAVATVKSQVETYIDFLKSIGTDFIFCVPPFDSGATGNTVNQQQYIDAVIASCYTKGCAIFDIRKAWISKTNAEALGYMSAADAVHPRIAGQANRAKFLKSLLRYGMGITP